MPYLKMTKTCIALLLSLVSMAAHAAYVVRPSAFIANGQMTFTGNTIGLNKAANVNAPGNAGSIGAFITQNCALQDGTYPPCTTADWRLNGSSGVLDIPAGATVLYAELIWSGSYVQGSEDVTAFINSSITLEQPNGTNTTITPDPATAQIVASVQYYTRSANVTGLVQAGGAGTYWAKGIPATQANNSNSGNTGGWTLAVIYSKSGYPARSMTLFVGAELGGAAAAQVSGFCTPSTPTQNGRLLVSAIEGDPQITGDQMQFGPTAATITAVSGPNNPVGNFFASQLNGDTGALDTRGSFGTINSPPGGATIGARQGYDIANVSVSAQLSAAQTTAFARGTTTGDQYMINALGIQVDVGSPKFPVTVKTVDKAASTPGDVLTYTIKLRNEGTGVATNVAFKDTVPAGTSFNAGSVTVQKSLPTAGAAVPSAGDPNSAAGVAIPDINPGEEYTVTFKVTVNTIPAAPATAQYANEAFWTYKYQSCAGQPIIDAQVNTDLAITKVPRLAVAKAVAPTGDVSVGDILTYTITVDNTGTAATTAATLRDAIPAGSSYVAGSTKLNGASVADTAGAMPFAAVRDIRAAGQGAGVIPAGGTATVSFQVRVSPGATIIANTATADVDGAGIAPAVSASTSNNVKPANLTITKTAVGAFVRGQNATFNIEVTNAASAGATDGSVVTVTDGLPGGLTLAATPSGAGWVCTGSSGATSFSCTRSDVLVAGATYPIISVPVRVLQSAPSPVSNTASVSGGGDSSPATGTASPAVSSSADLEVSKIANPANPAIGQNVTFTVRVTNNGVSDAANVQVNDPPPTGMTFVSATPSVGSYANPSWTVGTLATGSTATLTMVATYTGTTATNTASVTSSTPDPKPSNNTASVSVPSQIADLQLLKAVSTAAPNVGASVAFTLTLLNAGPDAATGVAVTDLLPAGLVFQSATPSIGAYNSVTGLWTVGSVPALGNATLVINAQVTGASPITNVAQVSASNQSDPNSTPGNSDPTENDQASVTLQPQSADLQLSKSVSNANPKIGAPLTYTITVTNKGPSPAQSVSVNETLPAGLTLSSAAPSIGSFAAPIWTVGTLANGASATLTINAVYTGPGQITNTATVSSVTPDPNTTNNTASQTVPAQVADLSLNKTVDNTTPDWGSNVTFTLTVGNAGPANASNVSVSDLLPVGLVFVSSTASQGSYDPASGNWALGSLPAADVATLQITARVDTISPIKNTAEIVKSDQYDPDSTPGNGVAGEDDIATVTLTPLSADLSIEKTANPNAAILNDPITYVVTVKNAGPGSAQGVLVTDLLPAGITFVGATVSQGSYDNASGLWTVGNMSNGASATLTISGTFTSTGPAVVVNYAQVQATTPDPNPTNNTSKAPIRAKEVDLVVSKVVTSPASAQVAVGSNATFRVTVRNTSATDAATNVKLSDVLPAGLTFVSATASSGSYASGSGLWYVPSVAANSSETLDIVATMTATSNQTNTAKLIGLDQYETNPANNEQSATVTPIFVDLVMRKTSNVAAPSIGQAVAFTLEVENLGPSNASGVTVNDPLPAGFTLSSAVPAAEYNSATGVWTVGAVNAGATRSLIVNAVFNGPGPASNVATIASVDQPDVNLTNNVASVSVPSQVADLKVSKTVDVSKPKPGDTVTFTIEVLNNGPDAATQVSVNDALPAGLTLLTASPSQGSYTAPVWTVGALANGGTATLTITAQVTATALVSNSASVSNPTQIDLNAGNNSASVDVTPQRAELSLTKTVDTSAVNVNANANFTITLSNAGPDPASNVVITDALPAGLAFVGATPSVGRYDAGTGKWTIDALPVGAATLALTARITQRGALLNSVSVTSLDQLDAPAGNTASVGVTGLEADVSVQKSVAPIAPLPGQAASFTITVTNNGPDPAVNVRVSDPLPAGFTYQSSSTTPPSGVYDPATGLLNLGTLAPSQQVVLTINGIFAGPAGLTNKVGVSSDTYDPTPANNSASVAIPSQVADLKVSKSVDVSNANFGSNVTFTITAQNLGPDVATGVAVTDLLPAGLTYVSSTVSTGSYAPGTGLWALGSLGVGSPVTLTITAKVTGTAPVTNVAKVMGSQFDPDVSNNTASADVVPVAANLRIAKGVNNGSPANNEVLTYTLTVTNDGPSAATPVTATDILPSSLVFVSAQPGQGTYDSATNTWNVGGLNANDNATLSLKVRYVANGTAATNTATVSSPVPDPDPSDNTRSVTIAAQIADLQLSKTASTTTPVFGSAVTFTVALKNNGPDAASNVVVRDSLPAGLLLVSATPSQGTYDAATGNWTVGTVANGAMPTLSIVATVNTAQTITNVAEVTASDQFDPNSTPNNGAAGENDQASVTLTPQAADLRVAKSVDNPQPNNGEPVVYTISVRNAGPSAAPSVVVQDKLPPGLLFSSASPSVGSYDPVSGAWTVGLLANNAVATLSIEAIYSASSTPISNTATATSGLPDPVPQDNVATATVFAGTADLRLSKSVTPPNPQVGGTVSYTITLNNDGPDTARNVVVRDALPAGLTLLTGLASQGNYDRSTGLWQAGTVLVGAPQTLTLTARVDAPTTSTNIAEVIASGQYDPNSTPNNSVAGENDQSSAVITPQVADLVVGKTASNGSPVPGTVFQYVLTVRNAGPDAATNVVLTDVLPAGISFTSASPTVGSYNPATGLWTVGTLANGATQTLTLNVVYQGPGIVVNQVTATADQFDSDPSNNLAQIAVPSQTAALTLSKVVDNATPNLGSSVSFTVTVRNAGPDAATNLEVRDVLPVGLTLVSATPTAGSYAPATGGWTIASLAANSSATLTIVATATGTAPVINTATISKVDQFDPSVADNTASVTVTPQAANLKITKVADNLKPAQGATVRFTITVTNNGPTAAQSVSVNESLPAGLSFVSAAPSVGSFSAGVWTIGTLANGATASLVVTTTYTAPGTVVLNQATVSSTTPDTDTTDNTASQAVPADGPDLVVSKQHVGDAVIGDVIDFTLTVRNNGGSASVGTISVSDTMPAGFLPQLPSPLQANGWACTLTGQVVACTRSDSIQAGQALPILTLRANVSVGAAVGSVQNVATVSGGGDVLASNNQSTDTVNVVALPVTAVPTWHPLAGLLMTVALLGLARRRLRTCRANR